MKDPLATLLKLRELELAAARRDLAERRARADQAAACAETARESITIECGGAVHCTDTLAAWLPVARASLDRAASEARITAQAAEASRSALADHRARARSVEWLLERRAAEARAERLQREQAALDEAAQRR